MSLIELTAKVNASKAIPGFPIVTCRSSAEVFELVQASFDTMSLLAYLHIIRSGMLVGWDVGE